MIYDHCLSVLDTGHSEYTGNPISDDERVIFKIQSGITTHKLDSLKTALIMIEVIKLNEDSDPDTQMNRMNHFIDYIFDTFSEASAMALFKYAIANRVLVIKKLSKSKGWKRVKGRFEGLLLDPSSNQKSHLHRSFERVYAKLIAFDQSSSINGFVASHLT